MRSFEKAKHAAGFQRSLPATLIFALKDLVATARDSASMVTINGEGSGDVKSAQVLQHLSAFRPFE